MSKSRSQRSLGIYFSFLMFIYFIIFSISIGIFLKSYGYLSFLRFSFFFCLSFRARGIEGRAIPKRRNRNWESRRKNGHVTIQILNFLISCFLLVLHLLGLFLKRITFCQACLSLAVIPWETKQRECWKFWDSRCARPSNILFLSPSVSFISRKRHVPLGLTTH